MIRLAAAVLVALSPLPVSAAQPQLIWEGSVDGVVVLHIHEGRLKVEVLHGEPVESQRFRFSNRLPDSEQEVRLNVLQGRGHVFIQHQPDLENDYTLSVMIEDIQNGRSPYSIEMYWDPSLGSFPGLDREGTVDRLRWRGKVDGEAIVECRAAQCSAHDSRGEPVARARAHFSSPLPEHPIDLRASDPGDRGEIRILQQPREDNNYTARIRVRNDQGRPGDCSFTLSWVRPPSGNEPAFARRGLFWSGTVDGRVRVTIQGSSSLAQVLRGGPIQHEKVSFDRPLPPHSDLTPTVKKLQGHGTVKIVESPSDRNGHQLVFEIDNGDHGPEQYEIQFAW